MGLDLIMTGAKEATMSKVTDYKILESADYDELTRWVKEEFTTGWQPLGGVAVVNVPYEKKFIFFQAMAK
jgi:hypothetical protein